jgi:hypothetical protein
MGENCKCEDTLREKIAAEILAVMEPHEDDLNRAVTKGLQWAVDIVRKKDV